MIKFYVLSRFTVRFVDKCLAGYSGYFGSLEFSLLTGVPLTFDL